MLTIGSGSLGGPPDARATEMRSSWLAPLAALGVSLAAPARAQPVFGHAESLEATVANADLVVVGTLRSPVDGGPPGSLGAAIDVEEVLKARPGEHYERLGFSLPASAKDLTRGSDRPRRLLLAMQDGAMEPAAILVLERGGLEVLAADFTLLRDPADVIRIARETARRMPPGVKRVHTVDIEVPRPSVAGTRWARYSGIFLSVPVDDRLEARARDLLRSDDGSRRIEGVKALRHFKSAENIARLRPLLDDPTSAYLSHAEEDMGREVKVFPVREAAYEALKGWGVEAPRPVTRVEAWRPEAVRLVALTDREVSDADLKGLARFENLEELVLRNTPVTDANLGALAGLKHLRTLTITGTRVTDEGLRTLAGFRSLRFVEISRDQVTDAAVAEVRHLRPDLKIERP